MKKYLICLALLVLIAFGVFAGINFTHSPEFALFQVVQAFQNKDLAKFEQYVDIPHVSNSLVNLIIDESTKDKTFQESPLAISMMEAYRPALQQEIQKGIQKSVVGQFQDKNFETESKKFMSLEPWKLFLFKENKEWLLQRKEQSKSIAVIKIINKKNKNFTLITLLKGKYWRITEIMFSNSTKLHQ